MSGKTVKAQAAQSINGEVKGDIQTAEKQSLSTCKMLSLQELPIEIPISKCYLHP